MVLEEQEVQQQTEQVAGILHSALSLQTAVEAAEKLLPMVSQGVLAVALEALLQVLVELEIRHLQLHHKVIMGVQTPAAQPEAVVVAEQAQLVAQAVLHLAIKAAQAGTEQQAA